MENVYRQNDIAMLLHVDSNIISRFATIKGELKYLNMFVAWAERLGSYEQLIAVCEECSIQIRLKKNCSCTGRRLLN
ncbi:hypothetical protein KQI88_14480 [Alkaliphilus sp. MSJ-5]|uniref:Uncharacterized protein n=1 Tax=Alkaliphilus flagellatus TaxID=2841507 RepID=A0ABS6G8A8_9FIRM|nr:hypothetical protein [Alkaliphilus flagellatus]MBU5677626.1 hypothetical protein [Alkaliphilus flagellatus]